MEVWASSTVDDEGAKVFELLVAVTTAFVPVPDDVTELEVAAEDVGVSLYKDLPLSITASESFGLSRTALRVKVIPSDL